MAEAFVTGGAAAFAAFDRLVADVEAATQHAVMEGAAEIQRQARQNSSGRPGPNVVTGAHRAGIITDGPHPAGLGSWLARVFGTQVYSPVLEDGSRRWPPGVKYPWLGPAVTMVEGRVRDLLERAWSAAIRRA